MRENRDANTSNSKKRSMSEPPVIGMGFGGGPGRPMTMEKVRAKNTKETLRRLWNYLSEQRKGLLSVFILTALSSGFGLIGPYLIGSAIDIYIIPKDYNGLLLLCIVLLGVYLFGAVTNWILAFAMARLSQRVVWKMRNDLFAKFQTLPVRFFDSKTHGELISRTTNDIESISNTLNQGFSQLISSVLTLAGTLVIMLSLNVWMMLLSIVTIPLVMLITHNIAGFTRRHFAEQQKTLGELNGFIEETVSGQKIVMTLCREEKAAADFNVINAKLNHVGIQAQIFTGLMGPVMNLVNNLSFAVIACGGGWMALTGITTVGVAVSFVNYSKQLGGPINQLANQFNMIQAAVAGAERVFEIMDIASEYEETLDQKEVKKMNGEVVFENVYFGYKEEAPVLQEITLTANPGDTIALVGPTGAGKTTIVNLLTRFYEINRGTVTIDGENIHQLEKNNLRRQLGIVLQDAYVFSDTVRENIRYGKLDATDQEVEAAAKLANADSFIRKLTHGYDTVLSAEGSNLSHGQRQLITIARAILVDPAILILDEATSSIDTRTEMHIQEAMKTLMKGRTSFVIAHRLSTIRQADQILVIHGGKIIERGTHHQLLADKGFYFDLYTSQFKRVG